MEIVNRVLRYVNALLALGVLAALAAAYWFFWRPLPKTSGALTAGVREKVTIVRDSLGVPHIRAASIEDALFGQGYVTAQDRLWQMDAIRRLASGELAEIVGAAAVERDTDTRRLRLRRAAEAHAAALSDAERATLAAYARGVNEFIDANRNNLPVEFRMLGYQPRPWSIADSIVIGLHMHRTLTTTWDDEILKWQMLRAGDAAKVAQLFPVRDGGEVTLGSNAWAISGARTVSGKPILANDPHLEFSFPATWYQVHLQGGALNVIGVSLPGVPCVIIGHNERIAWGVTNLGFDVQDLYAEKLDAATGLYAYRGQLEQARLETETIAVKGEKPRPFRQWITRHGAAGIFEGNQAFALRWTATEPGTFQFPFVELNLAQNWDEFRAALRRYPGPGQNFVYADTSGNIGYQATGLLPLRRAYDGDVPTDGSSGETEWDGYIPFELLPSAYNPASGTIVTANQNPWRAAPGVRVNGSFAAPYRASQIEARLASKAKWTAEEMLAIQTDVYAANLHALARTIAKVGGRDGDAVALLRDWNGQMDQSLAAPLAAYLTFRHLRTQLAEIAAPGKGLAWSNDMSAAVVSRLVNARDPAWSRDWDGMLRKAFDEAVEEGKRMQGPDVKKWRWGAFQTLDLPHPVLSRLPRVGKYFRIGPAPMSGSSTTVKQTTTRIGPSMRLIADLSDWEKSWNNVTIGQSGHPFSGHFRDQWDEYYAGRSFPMRFAKVEGKVLTLEPRR
jgi:penicillin amidase